MTEARCPNCDARLKAVSARARTGYLIALDQCPQCGGLWCDRFELFPIDAADVHTLDPLDQPALWAPVASVKRDLKCPRCRAALRRFHDPLLPADARIERCPACEGLWLNRGELRRFKQARAAPASRPAPLSDAAIQQLAQRAAPVPASAPVACLAQVDRPSQVETEEPAAGIGAWLRSAGWLILLALLRLLLGR
jgi:Zn-finger nucleic acid-binding protein